MNESVFLELLHSVVANIDNCFWDNYDQKRYGIRRRTPRLYLKELVFRVASRFGFVRISRERKAMMLEQLGNMKIHQARWEEVFRLYQDDESRRLLVLLLVYRLLGHRHVILPLNREGEWEKLLAKSAALLVKRDTGILTMGQLSWPINRYDLKSAGYDCQLDGVDVANTFLLEQYHLKRNHYPDICIQEGDVVVDGGGCMGDTALYAACRAGTSGRVFCFEFDANNLVWLNRNIEMNPHLQPRIQVMPFALWSRGGESVSFDGSGPSTRVTVGGDGGSTQSMAIDELIGKGMVDRIDFIKMDIEGAELKALQGAERVLRQFKPRLAISVYHREDDLREIPLWINNLGLDIGSR